MGALTAPGWSTGATVAAGGAAGASPAGAATLTVESGDAAVRATRMRRSPTEYSISVKPVSSSSAASARTRSLSIGRSLRLGIGLAPPSVRFVGSRFKDPCHGVERQQIALRAEPHDDAGGDQAHIGMMPPLFAAMDVREVHLDDGYLHELQRIVDGDRGVREPRRVDHDAVGALPGLLDPVDDLALVVRLAEIDVEPELARALGACSLDVR